jgi:hypothetical protein
MGSSAGRRQAERTMDQDRGNEQHHGESAFFAQLPAILLAAAAISAIFVVNSEGQEVRRAKHAERVITLVPVTPPSAAATLKAPLAADTTTRPTQVR